MRNPQQRARRIPSYVTTREEHVEKQYETSNRLVIGLLVASVCMAFVSSVISVVNLISSKKQ